MQNSWVTELLGDMGQDLEERQTVGTKSSELSAFEEVDLLGLNSEDSQGC